MSPGITDQVPVPVSVSLLVPFTVYVSIFLYIALILSWYKFLIKAANKNSNELFNLYTRKNVCNMQANSQNGNDTILPAIFNGYFRSVRDT